MSAYGDIRVGAVAPMSTVDWPGELSAVLFLRGCPWRCPYCHNPDMQKPKGPSRDWSGVMNFLGQRRGLLDGVVFSGGEPCMQANLIWAIQEVRALGFKTALHTGGHYPERLRQLLDAELLDWVGFDVKGPWEDYARITGRADAGQRARRSLELLVASGVDYELRTTVDPRLLDADRLSCMADELGAPAHDRLVLQRCNPTEGHDQDLPPFSLKQMAEGLSGQLGLVAVRN